MKKLSSIGAVVFGALIAGLAVLGFFSPAQAYPEVGINLTVDHQVLYGGESFTATATSTGATCSWSLEWDGRARQGSSTAADPFITTYTTSPPITAGLAPMRCEGLS